jgi:hypothetical protein
MIAGESGFVGATQHVVGGSSSLKLRGAFNGFSVRAARSTRALGYRLMNTPSLMLAGRRAHPLTEYLAYAKGETTETDT